ncbi:MAG: sensor histidine kinase, partial [Nautiliaceae bacterium]
MKLSLNTIYLGGVSLLFILSLIFTSLAIYEEYKDFENELQTFKQTYIKNKKKELSSTALKVVKIVNTTKVYKKILDIILPNDLYVKIYKNNKIIYTHSKEISNSITLSLTQKDIKIILKKPLNDLKQLIKEKKELLIHKLIKIMLNFLTLSFIIYMFALWGFYLLNKFLKQEIALFVEFFKDAYQKHKYIKFKDIKIKEFLDIAIYVNKMLKELNRKNKELKELN